MNTIKQFLGERITKPSGKQYSSVSTLIRKEIGFWFWLRYQVFNWFGLRTWIWFQMYKLGWTK